MQIFGMWGLSREAIAGAILLLATVLGLAAANSPMLGQYEATLAQEVTLGIAPLAISKSVQHWINDGLMAIFFLVVGLEIKREAMRGALSRPKSAALPIVAAVGGMVAPAAIYCAINWDNAAALRGWAIPSATDIAFAVGVLAVLGKRVPASLKIFLLALAIIDDLGAIIIIAAFYTGNLSFPALGLAAVAIGVLTLMNRAGVTRITPYLLVGAFLWTCVLKSGVHATLAGVVTALTIPMAGAPSTIGSPLEKLEHALTPFVSFVIVPLFAFANAGVSLSGLSLEALSSPIPLGIALGLVLGKPLGIILFSRAAVVARLADMPAGASPLQFLGTAVLGGIGFTMSLFIGLLAFSDATSIADVKLGVLTGSLISATIGYLILRFAARPKETKRGKEE